MEVRNILIFGSCVSRDIFNLATNSASSPFRITDYFARSSLASAFHPVPVADSWTQHLQSPFQQRIVAADLAKTFAKTLESLAFDVLLMDFIDERFNLFETRSGGMCTVSAELVNAGFNPKAQPGKLIASGTETFFSRWEAGWEALIMMLDAMGAKDRLCLNKVWWAGETESGNQFLPSWSARGISMANAFLDRLYTRCMRDLKPGQCLEYHRDLFVGSDNHRWGAGPFHYVDAWYVRAYEELVRVAW